MKRTRRQKIRYQQIGASMRAMDRQARAFMQAVEAGDLVMTVTRRVLYSCPACGLVDVGCDVPARGAEDVIAWLEQTMIVTLSRDHARRSPGCHPQSLKDIKIPITGTDRVGGPAEQ